jgi:hypothetical protein
MPHNTRSKRTGPLHDKDELDKVRGRIENDYLQRAMDFYGMKGRIDPERLDDVLEKAAEYKAAAKKKGGRRTRRGRKSRSTRRR